MTFPGAAPIGDQTPDQVAFSVEQLRRLRRLLGRTPFYCEEDYFLLVTIQNSIVGQAWQSNIRFTDLDGVNKSFTSQAVGLAADRANHSFGIRLAEGLLFGVAIAPVNVLCDLGTCHINVQLLKGIGTSGTVLQTLIDGYATTSQQLSWPNTPIRLGAVEGYYRAIFGTTPAAGVEVKETCPTGARWDVISVNLQLTPANDGATRLLRFIVNQSSSNSFISIPSAAGLANTVQNYVLSQSPLDRHIQVQTTDTFLVPILKPCLLLAGDFFTTQTFTLAATDQWAQPVYTVLETLRAQ